MGPVLPVRARGDEGVRAEGKSGGGDLRWAKALAKAALLAVREVRGLRWFMPLVLTALVIVVYLAAGQHIRKAIKRRSGVGQVAHATADSRSGSCLHSVFWPIEHQSNPSPTQVVANWRIVWHRMLYKVSRNPATWHPNVRPISSQFLLCNLLPGRCNQAIQLPVPHRVLPV